MKTLPTSANKKEPHWLKRVTSPPEPEGKREANMGLVGPWRHVASGHQVVIVAARVIAWIHSGRNSDYFICIMSAIGFILRKENYAGSETTPHIN
eukprot:1143408-Pelagomonas_calceolata.AAC.6